MSRRSTNTIAIHNVLNWVENNLRSPLSLEEASERSGYSKWYLQRMFKKEADHSLGQYIHSRKMTEIAQKLKESNEPILCLAERYGFRSQQTLTRTFENYFDVPPHKYRMTNMHDESRYLFPLNQCSCQSPANDVTEEIVKLLSYAMLALMFVISSQSMVEQTAQPATQNSRDAMIIPPAHDQSPFDFNHMGTGSDKSDELGVPYYNICNL